MSIDRDLKVNDALLFFTLHEYADYQFNKDCTPTKDPKALHFKMPMKIGDLFIATEVRPEVVGDQDLNDPFCD